MADKKADKARSLKPQGELSACPACGYGDGFHVSFRIADNRRSGMIILICPDCHARFDPGWPVAIGAKGF